jgi:putative endonuclease
MNFAYILRSEVNGVLYKGSTEDLEARLTQHNSGMVNYTSKYMPWKLIHFEAFDTRSEAMARERFFKSGRGRDWLKQHLAV